MKWIKKVATTPLDNTAKVIDTLESQENEHTNAPSINAVRAAIAEYLSVIYPVGSIYMNVDNVNPGILFGGVWEQIQDKYILASGTVAAGGTGGANYIDVTSAGVVGNHTLTTAELPSHTHTYTDRWPDAVDHQTASAESGSTVEFSYVNAVHVTERTTTTAGSGSGGAHNHGFTGITTRYNYKPEYIAVNVWKRVG